jgi:hypothetical protein
MNRETMMQYVREILGDTDTNHPRFDDDCLRRGLEAAIADTNVINPKNQQKHTLDTVPDGWLACVPEGAAAHCLRERADQLDTSDPKGSARFRALADSHDRQFRNTAKRVMANRPTSAR